jgi:hypothetical protein
MCNSCEKFYLFIYLFIYFSPMNGLGQLLHSGWQFYGVTTRDNACRPGQKLGRQGQEKEN